jgi:hypothetical protein
VVKTTDADGYIAIIKKFASTYALHVDIYNGGMIHCEYNIANPYLDVIDEILFIISLDDDTQFLSIFLTDILSIGVDENVCNLSFESAMVTLYNDY